MTLYSSLKRRVCYLLRKPRTYGFGVQSPFAYHFVRKVLVGRTLVSLDDFGVKGECSAHFPLRTYLLFARLSAYIRSQHCFVSQDLYADALVAAITAGYTKVKCDKDVLASNRFCVVSTQFADWDVILNHMASDGMLVVLGLRSNRQSYAVWKSLMRDERTCVSFDLYDVGILFFDHKMYKRSYRCNFR